LLLKTAAKRRPQKEIWFVEYVINVRFYYIILNSKSQYRYYCCSGGEGGIRTLDEVAPIPPFQDGALGQLCDLSVKSILAKTTSDYFTTLISCIRYLPHRKLIV
jgi:hypothetical protein